MYKVVPGYAFRHKGSGGEEREGEERARKFALGERGGLEC